MRLYIIAALLGLVQTCFAQLDIGDTLPYVKLGNVLGSKQAVDTKAYKGKLLIIDFWSLNCVSCIRAMPKLDSLQHEYGDRLQIIMVTQDTKAMVEKFFAARRSLKLCLPVIAEDTILSKLFPHEFVPHHIWINEQGIVTYITGGANTNVLTIRAYLKGEKLAFTKQVINNFDVQQPIWTQGADHIRYYSTLSGFLPDYPFYYYKVTDTKAGVTGFKLLNAPLLTLYKMAWGGLRRTGEFAKDIRIILEVKDSSVFFQVDPLRRDSLIRSHAWSYEAVTPPIPESAFCEMLRQELARYFPYEVAIEKRECKVIVLEQVRKQPLSPLNAMMDAVTDSAKKKIYFHQSPVSQLTKPLHRRAEREGKIFIDSSGVLIIDSLVLSYPMGNWKIIERELQSFGWVLREKKLSVDMLVIKDKPGGTTGLSD